MRELPEEGLSSFSEKGHKGERTQGKARAPSPPCRGLFLTGGGNIPTLVPPGRVTASGWTHQGVVAALEGVCPAPSGHAIPQQWLPKSRPWGSIITWEHYRCRVSVLPPTRSVRNLGMSF